MIVRNTIAGPVPVGHCAARSTPDLALRASARVARPRRVGKPQRPTDEAAAEISSPPRLLCCWLLCCRLLCCWLLCCGLQAASRARRCCWPRSRREGGIDAPKPIEANRLRPNVTIGTRQRVIRADAKHACGQHAALAKAQDNTTPTLTGRKHGRTEIVTRGQSVRPAGRTAIEGNFEATARTVWR